MVYSAKSDDVNTISQFTRSKKIIITTDGTSTPANYQVLLDDLAYEPEMEASFADVRFNTKTGVYIDYWIESHVDSTSADVWVELPDAITDPGTDYIWMYYGNKNLLTDGSDGPDTFLQWHGVATANYNDDSVIAVPFIWEGKVRRTSDTGWFMVGVSDQQITYPIGSGDDSLSISPQYTFEIYAINHNDGVESYLNKTTLGSVWVLNQWYRIKIEARASNNIVYYVQDLVTGNAITTNVPDATMGLNLYLYQGTSAEQEFTFLHKYIANEPTVSYGTAQHQRRTPQFM